MTIRAVILGFLGAVFMCAFTYFNDHVIRQTWMIFSSMPTAVYGGLMLVLLLLNPALKYAKKKWGLTGTELAVALALTLVPCAIPGAGLMETFPNVVMMPHHQARTNAGWKAEKIIDSVPPYMLPDVSQDEETALTGYVQGLSVGDKQIAVSEVPWSAWTRTLLFWVPVVLLLWGALIGLALVVHRQWSEHEKLPYPIATFTEALLPPDDESAKPIYFQRMFWIGCGAVCAYHLMGYLFVWSPEHIPDLPRRFDFSAVGKLFPSFWSAGGWWLSRPMIVFTVIGLAYFLPKDMSFSVGIGPFLYCSIAGMLAGYGIAMGGGGWYEMNLQRSLQAGAYAGMLVLTIYAGRRYYKQVFLAAIGKTPEDDIQPHAVWGARAFMACSFLFFLVLVIAGLDWPLAILYTVMILTAYLLMGRLSAETGFIFIQAWWEPAALIVGLMGVRAVGASMAVMMFLLSSALILDTRESIMPFILNSLRVVGNKRVSLGKTSLLAVAALVIGLAVAIPTTLYIKYDRGTNLWYHWCSQSAPRFAFDEGVRVKQRLRTQGKLESAESVSGFGRLLAISPSGKLVAGFAVAFVLFLVLSFARLRLPRWPIHPVLLLLWTTYPASRLAPSFLMGFMVKWLVVKYGGDKAYQKLKPVMIGLVAGDMLFGLSTSIIGSIYYVITGVAPPRFSVFW